MAEMPFLRPGETVWRLERAGRIKFLVDYEAYFDALRTALALAQRSIHVLGWGFDPRTRLNPAAPSQPGAPDEIGHALVRLAREKPVLDVRVLVWRSALPISASQAFFPHRAKAWFKGSPVKFLLDAATPLGACHHQKAVIIDDQLAFLGGGDIGPDRWDSAAHLDADPRRLGPGRKLHSPRHEVMVLAEGAVAEALGVLFRDRWTRARAGLTVDDPVPLADRGVARWPPGLAADLAAASAGIGRTAPAWRAHRGADEIARLTLETIGRATRLIYLENQYFTWPAAIEALAARLAEPKGPEVVAILSAKSPSYFDRLTMDCTRSLAIWRLMAADVFGRFHVFAPVTAGHRPIIVHAKAMIADDRLVRISSANLNNRSQGFDTEVELALEATRPDEEAVIGALRDRLAGHWIDRPGEEVRQAREGVSGLGQALIQLDGGRRLRPLRPQRLGPIAEFIAAFHLGDPRDPRDSWRAWRRRRRLAEEARAVRAHLTEPDGSPPRAADDPTRSAIAGRAAS